MTSQLPEIGKVSPDIFAEIILPRLGHRRAEVLVGPQNGVDIAVVDLGHGQVMVTTTDPVFVVPRYGWERSAWFAVHILASDAVTSGLAPSYLTIDLNLPLSVTRAELEALWSTIHRECERIGMAVISGHTGRYEGCGFPMIGGATVICIGPRERCVAACRAQPGDQILITKGPAIEAAGLFAVTFPERLAAAHGARFAEQAQELFWQMTVVDDALTAVQAGVGEQGVTAMHDATECGVWGALVEVAQASGVGLVVHQDAIAVQPQVRAICELFAIDPYAAISEGTLVITCRPHRAPEVLARLRDRGIPTSLVGEVLEASAGMTVVDERGRRPLVHPRVDPFWAAFGKAAAREEQAAAREEHTGG